MPRKNSKSIFWNYLAFFVIFNQLLVFCPKGLALPHADVTHLHSIFGEETTSHILRRAKKVPLTRGNQGAYSLDLGAPHGSEKKGASGPYSLPFNPGQQSEIIYFHDGDISIGTWVYFHKIEGGVATQQKEQGHGIFIGSKELRSDIEIDCPLFLASLTIETGGRLRFLQDITLTETANIRSRSLSVSGSFSSGELTQFNIQEALEILKGGNVTSTQQIEGRFQSLINRGSIKAQDDISLKGGNITNHGLIEGTRKLVLEATTLINRGALKAYTLMVRAHQFLDNLRCGAIDVVNRCELNYGTFRNERGTLKVGGSLRAEGGTFENKGGVLKINGSFVLKGENFHNQPSNASWGTLEVGTPQNPTLYQVLVDKYCDSGTSTWNGLALIQAHIVDLAGTYRGGTVSITAEKSLIVRGESHFSISHCLELKSSEGVVEFGGTISVNPIIAAPVFPESFPLASFVKKMSPGVVLAGSKKLIHRGPIYTNVARYSASEGKFISTGQSYAEDTTFVEAQEAHLNGVLHASKDIIISVQKRLHMAGEIAARNLKVLAQSLFISGPITTTKNASLQGENKVELAKSGSLRIGEVLAVSSDGDVIMDGRSHAKRSTVQGNTITMSGPFAVEELAHFKADSYFSNWKGSVQAKDIKIDASIILNWWGSLSATRSLSTDALLDFNLGTKTAHHILSNSIYSLDLGLSLPSLHPSDLLTWQSTLQGLKAAALSFCPGEIRSLLTLGTSAFSVCTKSSELYKKYTSLEDRARFSDFIPLLLGIKDLSISIYTTAKNAGAFDTQEIENCQQVSSDTQQTRESLLETPSLGTPFLQTTQAAAKAGASIFLPSITQASVVSHQAGLRLSAHVYEHGIMSQHVGATGALTYRNDFLYACNEGLIGGHQIENNNSRFHNGGLLVGLGGDVRGAGTEQATNAGFMGSIGSNASVVLQGKSSHNSGVMGVVGHQSHVDVLGIDQAQNSGIIESSGDHSRATVIAEKDGRTQPGSIVRARGNKSAAMVGGRTVDHSGIVESSGNQVKAFVIAEATVKTQEQSSVISTGHKSVTVVQGGVSAESLGTVKSQGTTSVFGFEKTAIGGSSIIQGESVLIGQGYAQETHENSPPSVVVLRSTETLAEEGGHISGDEVVMAGDSLQCDAFIKASALSIESAQGHILNPQTIESTTAYVSLGQNGNGAQGAIDLANELNVGNVVTNVSDHDFLNFNPQTITGDNRTFIFRSVDNSAPIQATGTFILEGVEGFRTRADISAARSLGTFSGQGAHETLDGAVLKAQTGSLFVYGKSSLKLASALKQETYFTKRGRKSKTNSRLIMQRGGWIGDEVYYGTQGDFDNEAGQIIARRGSLKSDVGGDQYESALECNSHMTSHNIDGTQTVLHGGEKAARTYARVEMRGFQINENVTKKLTSEGAIRIAIYGGETNAGGGIETKVLTYTYVVDKGKERSGFLWHHKEKWEREATDFYRCEFHSPQGHYNLVSSQEHLDLPAVNVSVAQPSTVKGKEGVDLGAAIARNHYEESHSSGWGFFQESSSGFREVAQVADIIGKSEIKILSSEGSVTGKVPYIQAPSIYIHGKKGIDITDLSLSAQDATYTKRLTFDILGVDVISPSEQPIQLAPTINLGMKRTEVETISSWEHQGCMQADHLQLSTGEGEDITLRSMNLIGLSQQDIKLVESETDNFLLRGSVFEQSVETSYSKEAVGIAYNGEEFVPTGSFSFRKEKDEMSGVQKTEVWIQQLENRRKGLEISVNDVQGNIDTVSGENFTVFTDPTQTIHLQQSIYGGIGFSGNNVSLSGGMGGGSVSASTETDFTIKKVPNMMSRTDTHHENKDTRSEMGGTLTFDHQADSFTELISGWGVTGQFKGQHFHLNSSLFSGLRNASTSSSGSAFDNFTTKAEIIFDITSDFTTMASNALSIAALGGADVERPQTILHKTTYTLDNARGILKTVQAGFSVHDRIVMEWRNTPILTLSTLGEREHEEDSACPVAGTQTTAEDESDLWVDFPDIIALKETGRWDQMSLWEKMVFEHFLMEQIQNRAELEAYASGGHSLWEGATSIGKLVREIHAESQKMAREDLLREQAENRAELQAYRDMCRDLWHWANKDIKCLKALNENIDQALILEKECHCMFVEHYPFLGSLADGIARIEGLGPYDQPYRIRKPLDIGGFVLEKIVLHGADSFLQNKLQLQEEARPLKSVYDLSKALYTMYQCPFPPLATKEEIENMFPPAAPRSMIHRTIERSTKEEQSLQEFTETKPLNLSSK